MLTRGAVSHQYGQQNGAPPPFHATMHQHQYPEPGGRGRMYGAGGLLGGAVTLSARGMVGMRQGGSGYGYLGMDPSDPATWPRPFNPQPGMISWLNFYGNG
jgi:hypothetical protein